MDNHGDVVVRGDNPIVDKDIEDCGYEDSDDASGNDRTIDRHEDKILQDDNEEDQDGNELRLMVRTLWKTGLEVFIHQLLYRRGIYPRDTFCSTRFVGVDCKINNNPGVLFYIADALKEIIPLLFGDEGMDKKNIHGPCGLREILIEVYDQSTEITQEQYSLLFSSPHDSAGSTEQDMVTSGLWSSFSNSNSHLGANADLSDYVIGEVERDLRDLVCSTGKLERPQSLVWNDSVSFKIRLRLNQSSGKEPTAHLDERKWSKTRFATGNLTRNRVLLNLVNFACQCQYKLTSTEEKIQEDPSNVQGKIP